MQWNNTSFTGMSSRIIHVRAWARVDTKLQVFNSISHEWDIKLNTRREIPHLQAAMYYFVYCLRLKIKITTFLTIFRRFPTTFPKISKITFVSEHFPKISVHYQSCRRLPSKIRRCFDHTPTNWSTPYSDKWIKMVNFELGIEMWKANRSTGHEPGTKKKIDSFRGLRFFRCTTLVSLPDFKPWRTRYESVNYGISNYWST